MTPVGKLHRLTDTLTLPPQSPKMVRDKKYRNSHIPSALVTALREATLPLTPFSLCCCLEIRVDYINYLLAFGDGEENGDMLITKVQGKKKNPVNNKWSHFWWFKQRRIGCYLNVIPRKRTNRGVWLNGKQIYSAERSSGKRRPLSQQYKRLHQSSAPGLSSDGGTEIWAAGLMQGRWGSFSYTWLVNKAFNSRPQQTNPVVFLFLNGCA